MVMLQTSGRLLRLLSLLQDLREWTGSDLAVQLDVSTRTVRADIGRLRSLGYPVHASRGSTGGYRLAAGAELPPLLLDDEEAIAVALGLRTAAVGAIGGIEDTSLRALAKLERVLPVRLRRRLNALSAATLAVPPDQPGPLVDARTLGLLAAACRDQERVSFEYRDHRGGGSARSVEPHRLVSWGRRWYLVAWDPGPGDWRTFRVDRISGRPATGPRFHPRPPPQEDLAAYVSRGVSA